MADFIRLSSPFPQHSSRLQILVAFLLLDKDGDGQLVFEEVTEYIASVLRVLCAVGQDVTRERCFRHTLFHFHARWSPPVAFFCRTYLC